jgi:hypothetical protein
MNNVQNCDSYVNIPSSQTYRSYELRICKNTKVMNILIYQMMWVLIHLRNVLIVG